MSGGLAQSKDKSQILLQRCSHLNKGVPSFVGVRIKGFQVSSFQGVGIEGFHCIKRCPHFRVLEYRCIQRCSHFRVLE